MMTLLFLLFFPSFVSPVVTSRVLKVLIEGLFAPPEKLVEPEKELPKEEERILHLLLDILRGQLPRRALHEPRRGYLQ